MKIKNKPYHTLSLLLIISFIFGFLNENSSEGDDHILNNYQLIWKLFQ